MMKELEKKKSAGASASAFNIKFKGLCNFCNRQGHKEKECWKKHPHLFAKKGQQQQQQQQNTQQGGQRGRGGYSRGGTTHRGSMRGRGDNTYQQQQQQQQRSGSNSNEQTHAVWTIEVNNNNVSSGVGEKYNKVKWLLDSGCSNHIINNENFFFESVLLKNPVEVKLPDGKALKATKVGNMKIYFKNYNNESQVELKNVFFVEGIRKNLLSFAKISESCTIVAKGNDAKIYDTISRKLITVAEKINDLYFVNSQLSLDKEIFVNALKLTDKEKWHRCLGHVNFNYLNKIVKNKMLDGLPDKIENIYLKCANCIQSKMHNLSFGTGQTKAKELLEIIHTDLNGPHTITGYGGEKYFMTFIDDYSKCTMIYCLKSKDQTASCFEEYVNLVENQLNKKVKKLKCDNGGEYLNNQIYNFIKSKGIELLPCPPYVHELNGVAERYNRSAMDIGRCLMREARINSIYWPEVIKTVPYLKKPHHCRNVGK